MPKLDTALTKLRAFLRDLNTSASAATDEELTSKLHSSFFTVRHHGTLFFEGDEAKDFRLCTEAIERSDGIHVGHRAVEVAVQTAILDALDVTGASPDVPFETRLRLVIEELRKHLLSHERRWRVLHPIEGLSGDGLPIKIGRVEFSIFDSDAKEALFERMDDVLETTTNVGRRSSRKDFGASVEGLADRVVAAVEVTALDGEAAISRATAELQYTMDVINFYSDLLVGRGLRSQISLHSELLPQTEAAVAEVLGTNEEFRIHGKRFGQLVPLSADALRSELADQLGFPTVSRLLTQRLESSKAERLLTAMRWAGRATALDRWEEAFLLYAVAFESLLLGSLNAPEITYRLSMRAAHLLADTGSARRDIAKQIGELYNVRSSIVHSGSVEFAESTLDRMRGYAKSAILRVLINPAFESMTTSQELDDWFEDRLLS